MFSLCLPPHHHQPMEAAFGRLHKGGRAAFGGAPTFVDSIVGDGEAANIAKTYAYTYQMCLYFHICHLSYYLPCVSSVEIGYSPTTSMIVLKSYRTGVSDRRSLAKSIIKENH